MAMPRFQARTYEPAKKRGKVRRKRVHITNNIMILLNKKKGSLGCASCDEKAFDDRCEEEGQKKEGEMLPGCETSQGSVIVSPTANLKASDLDINVGSFLFST